MDRQAWWDARYAEKDLVWGAEPNRFLAAALEGRSPRGRALDLACGEGRNAIWLATRGWRVSAVDFSEVALERARRIAAERGVEVDWICADVTAFEPEREAFALVAVLYLQLPAADRARVLDHAVAALAPGGELIMIGHALRNLGEGWGGPSNPDVLWDPLAIRAELEARGLAVEQCEEVLRPVEGNDAPPSAVAIDMIARATR